MQVYTKNSLRLLGNRKSLSDAKKRVCLFRGRYSYTPSVEYINFLKEAVKRKIVDEHRVKALINL